MGSSPPGSLCLGTRLETAWAESSSCPAHGYEPITGLIATGTFFPLGQDANSITFGPRSADFVASPSGTRCQLLKQDVAGATYSSFRPL